MSSRSRPFPSISKAFDRAFEAALLLRPKHRELLADLILGSLPGPVELSPEWEAEIKRRVEEVESGKAKLIPPEEAFDGALRKTLQRRRKEMRSGRVRGVSAQESIRRLDRQAAKRRSR
ncbi:MAG: addiction module protein [Planctomycetes bacterium]|nr:addiction module protein [Planctomycetota bacterium]